jgi:hypothetical protein
MPTSNKDQIPFSRETQIEMMTNVKERRASAVERWANDKELQKSLRMTAVEQEAQRESWVRGELDIGLDGQEDIARKNILKRPKP